MSNINWNQLFNNFTHNFNKVVQSNNLQNKPLASESLFANNQNNNPSNVLPNTVAQLKQTAAQLAILNQQQNANMVKELLNLPKNFQQILEQLVTKPEVAKEVSQLLLSSGLDLGKLSSLLQNNSKQALSNLYQMLAQYNQIGISLQEEQIAQITKLISTISSSSSSEVQSVRALMLLYLPWLPLTDPNAFKLEIDEKQQEGGLSSDDSVSILIATENYGNAKADIYKTEEDGIKIEFTTSDDFPQKDFAVLMQNESKKHNININIFYAKKEVFNKKIDEKKETQVCMNTSPGVNPFLLLISSAVIKNVHDIDNKDKLREKRKEMLDNG